MPRARATGGNAAAFYCERGGRTASSDATRLTASVLLIKALGGDWDTSKLPPL